MDQTRLAELRSWGTRLQAAGGGEEVRAAGRAIVMLVDEVEAQQARLDEAERHLADEHGPEPVGETPDVEAGSPGHGLRARIARTFGLASAEEDEPEPT
jgi:hypothetical protein